MSQDHINTSISGVQQCGKTKTHTGLEEVLALQEFICWIIVCTSAEFNLSKGVCEQLFWESYLISLFQASPGTSDSHSVQHLGSVEITQSQHICNYLPLITLKCHLRSVKH